MDFVSLLGVLFGSVLMWFVCLFGLDLFVYELSFGSTGFNLFCFVCLTFVGFVGCYVVGAVGCVVGGFLICSAVWWVWFDLVWWFACGCCSLVVCCLLVVGEWFVWCAGYSWRCCWLLVLMFVLEV